MNSVNPFETDAYTKVQHYFFDIPETECTLNDLCKRIKISKTTAKTAVNMLVAEGFLAKQVIGRLWRISCNQKHYYNKSRKIPYHLRLIYESNIISDIRKIIPSSRAIILFGSIRKGDDISQSDIDVAVEVLGGEQKIIELGKIVQLGYRKNVHVQVHQFSRNLVNVNVFSNIANGIVLDGFLEVKK